MQFKQISKIKVLIKQLIKDYLIVFWQIKKSGYDSKKNCRSYLKEINRILKPNSFFILISHSDPSQRLDLLKEIDWEIQSHKLYRTCLKEEKYQIQEYLLENDDDELKKSEFCKVLEDNLTKIDLSDVKYKDFHYAYICQKKEQLILNEKLITLFVQFIKIKKSKPKQKLYNQTGQQKGIKHQFEINCNKFIKGRQITFFFQVQRKKKRIGNRKIIRKFQFRF